jgi:selenium-binding protein 1
VASVNVGKEDPDFVAVIGVDPSDKAAYGKIVHRLDMLHIGDELHHFGYNHGRTKLMIPGLFSGRIYIADVSNPARPTMETVKETLTAKSGYIIPHTVIGLPNGNNLVTMMGANTKDTSPGGLVEINATTGEYVRTVGPPAIGRRKGVGPHYMYDLGIKEEINRAVTTSFGHPAKIGGGITVDGLGTDVYVWDWKAKKVIQTVNIGKGTGALEVRWRRDPNSTVGYTNAPGSDEIWAWHDNDGDGKFTFKPVIKLPKGSIPTDMLLSNDDKYMYIGNWMGNSVMQYNIEDPLKPRLTGKVDIPQAQMIRLSLDGKRLYVTNSLLSTWDDTELPKGTKRNTGYGVFLVDVDPENGGMTLNKGFHVDFDSVQKKTTVGPARPHMMLFDPAVKSPFGHH